jgi:hypothetical protein
MNLGEKGRKIDRSNDAAPVSRARRRGPRGYVLPRSRYWRWGAGRGAVDAEPGPDQGSTCNTIGGGTICRFSHVEALGPLDTGIVCGSGADAFDIFDQFVDHESRTWWYDENGNLTRRTDHDVYSFGQWSNPTTGATVPYTQHNVETDVLAVPGDFTSATITFTGENIYRPATGAPVLMEVGRQVFNWDLSQLLSSHGPNEIYAALYEGDPHAFDQMCAALGAS